jgi:hypothetical protein
MKDKEVLEETIVFKIRWSIQLQMKDKEVLEETIVLR